MKSLKTKVLLIVIAILSVITVYRLFNVNDTFKKNSNEFLVRQRLNSLANSKINEGLVFPKLETYTLDQKKMITSKTEVTDKKLIVLLSNIGCNPCQIRELSFIDSLLNRKKFDVKAIYFGENRRAVKLLKKVTGIKFPIFFSKDTTINQFYKSGKYPALFLVENQKVISNFIPLPEDDQFSKWYYNLLAKKL